MGTPGNSQGGGGEGERDCEHDCKCECIGTEEVGGRETNSIGECERRGWERCGREKLGIGEVILSFCFFLGGEKWVVCVRDEREDEMERVYFFFAFLSSVGKGEERFALLWMEKEWHCLQDRKKERRKDGDKGKEG